MRNYCYHEEEYKGFTIKIYQDESPCDPREWDNLGTMVCWHRNYMLGDKHNFSDPEDFQAFIKDTPAIVLPLFLYDHSGITMNTVGFHCPWDSGQVGWIYVTLEDIRKEYGVTRVSKQLRQKVADYLRAEVKTYDQYLTGEVYGYEVTGEDEEFIDSCWGFYGEYDAEDYSVLTEARDACDYAYKTRYPLLAAIEEKEKAQ